MVKYWCVNFENSELLNHGLKNRLWLMGYQYARTGENSPTWKAAITRNWRRLDEILVGDKFIAYTPGNRHYAIGSVINPRRAPKREDRQDSIEDYLKRGRAYRSGYVYFPPSVAYENFTDDYSGYPVRIDVDEWEHFSPEGVVAGGEPIPRHKSVYAAISIDKRRFDRIQKALTSPNQNNLLPEEVTPAEVRTEGAVKTIQVVAYERDRKARTQCIKHYGWTCAVCGYDMAELYGTHGEGLIHVHHLRDLSLIGGEYQVDPIKDLRPVCPNCHAILHTTKPAMSVAKLRTHLHKRGKYEWPR